MAPPPSGSEPRALYCQPTSILLHYPSAPFRCAQAQTSYSPLFSKGRKAIVPSEGKTVFQKRNGNVPPEKKRQASRNELPTATQREVTHKVFPKLFKAVSPANTTSQRGLPTKKSAPHARTQERKNTENTSTPQRIHPHNIQQVTTNTQETRHPFSDDKTETSTAFLYSSREETTSTPIAGK